MQKAETKRSGLTIRILFCLPLQRLSKLMFRQEAKLLKRKHRARLPALREARLARIQPERQPTEQAPRL